MSSPSAAGPRPDRPYYGSGYASVGFTGIGGHLLREFPRVTEPPAAPPAPIAEPTTYGPHLVVRMLPGADGSRLAPCPVCVTAAVVPVAAGSWVPLRCAACGTEFHASDGTPPPPPPPPVPAPPPMSVLASILAELDRPHPASPPPTPVPPAFPAERARWNLGRWVASGEPDRWVAERRGMWGEADFRMLIRLLRVSDYWPVEVREVRRAVNEATARYWAVEARLPSSRKPRLGSEPKWSFPRPPLPPPPPLRKREWSAFHRLLWADVNGCVWIVLAYLVVPLLIGVVAHSLDLFRR